MILQENYNKVSCLPTSLAMCVGVPVTEIIKIIGHDGTKRLWPELEEPFCFQGFYDQEIIYASLHLGYSVTPIEGTCEVSPNGVDSRTVDRRAKLRDYLKQFSGILIGHTDKGIGHAAAWDFEKQLVFDPRGFRMALIDFEKQFTIEGFLIILKSF